MRLGEFIHLATVAVVIVACICATVIAIYEPHDAESAIAVLTAAIGWAGGHAHANYQARRSTDRRADWPIEDNA